MSPGHGDVGVGVTVGVAGGRGLAVVLGGDGGGDGGSHSGRDELGSVPVAVVMFGGVDGADLASHLPVDWLADLAGDGATLLHLGLEWHSDGHRPAALSGHGDTGGVWDLADHSVAHSHGLLVTHSLGHFFLDNLTVLSGHRGTLGHSDTLGDCHAVGGGDLLVDGGADGDLHTVRDGYTLGN